VAWRAHVPLATNTGEGDRSKILGEISGQGYLIAMVPTMLKAVRKKMVGPWVSRASDKHNGK
jgi:hypothetical protein